MTCFGAFRTATELWVVISPLSLAFHGCTGIDWRWREFESYGLLGWATGWVGKWGTWVGIWVRRRKEEYLGDDVVCLGYL